VKLRRVKRKAQTKQGIGLRWGNEAWRFQRHVRNGRLLVSSSWASVDPWDALYRISDVTKQLYKQI